MTSFHTSRPDDIYWDDGKEGYQIGHFVYHEKSGVQILMDPSSEAVETILDKGVSRSSVRDYESEDTIQPLYPWLSPTVMNTVSGTVAGKVSMFIYCLWRS